VALIELNRAGTPLLEIVTQPDLGSAEDAVLFARELHTLCVFLEVTGGIMQRGHMRFEPNVNVIIETVDGREHATPIVEVKNLNSFKSVKGAIEYEYTRQIEQWKTDGLTQGPGMKSTRGWDDAGNCTVLQREKEDAHDYRYFPEPDLPPVVISESWKEEVAQRVPELPMARRARYMKEYGLSEVEAQTLTGEADLCLFYESCIEALRTIKASDVQTTASNGGAGASCAKWLLNAGAKRANERGVGIHELGISERQIAQIIDLRDRNQIGSNAADELFGLLCETDEEAMAVATARGMIQMRDDAALDRWVEEAIAAKPQAAADFKAGKDAAAGQLVGHAMKLSSGKADAKSIAEKLRARLRG